MSAAITLPCFIVALLLPIILLLRKPRAPGPQQQHSINALPSLLIPSYTSHARLLPSTSKHAFSYPLLYIGVDIDSLTSGHLDFGNRLFTYGGSPFSKLLGIRNNGYLTPGDLDLRTKVLKLLIERSGSAGDVERLKSDRIGRIWLVTMPSYLGWEGINPLSIWYVYSKEGDLVCVILEVHNTFGEKHAYVLPTESEFLATPTDGYDLSWVFPRGFHVSPFNSRDGYYRLDIIDPWKRSSHSPSPDLIKSPESLQPFDFKGIKVFLKLLTSDKTPKLQALLASHPTHNPIPLEPRYSIKLIYAIARWPFTLLLTTPRILFHAYELHYKKGLAVYPRPEPFSNESLGEWNPQHPEASKSGEAIGFQPVGGLERLAEKVVVRWMKQRSEDVGVTVDVEFRYDRKAIAISRHTEDLDTKSFGEGNLMIRTGDPKFFVNLLAAPSTRHYTLLAPELLTSISDTQLFNTFFSIGSKPGSASRLASWNDNLRQRFTQFFFTHSLIPPTPDLVHPSPRHFTAELDAWDQLRIWWILQLAFFADWLEYELMYYFNAKFVAGHEPWKIWERALRGQYTQDTRPVKSIREVDNDWVDLGSVQYH